MIKIKIKVSANLTYFVWMKFQFSTNFNFNFNYKSWETRHESCNVHSWILKGGKKKLLKMKSEKSSSSNGQTVDEK